MPGYPGHSIRLPFSSGVPPSNADVFGVSPHRVYMISLQHYLYILSVALVLPHLRRGDGRYPLCCTEVSGLSSPRPGRRAIRRPADAKLQIPCQIYKGKNQLTQASMGLKAKCRSGLLIKSGQITPRAVPETTPIPIFVVSGTKMVRWKRNRCGTLHSIGKKIQATGV